MHVAQVNFFDAGDREPERLLEDWYALPDLAEATAFAGLRVTVVQASRTRRRFEYRGVSYRFVPLSDFATELSTGSVPDVIHIHGLSFAREVIALRAMFPWIPFLLQHHADHVPRFWRRPLWRRAFNAAQGVSFCAHAQAQPFVDTGIMPQGVEVFEIPESTSRFVRGSREAARASTGLRGDPCVLWVGSLDRNKDPLTVLDGVAAAVGQLPRIELWCCFTSAPLFRGVQSKINAEERLRGRVHLVGRVSHDRIEELMQAADLFVLGSHREGGNFSLIEAMATGLTPVVTDIPSSRALTGNGAVGELWDCGDWQGLGRALRDAAAALGQDTRRSVREHFDAQLSGRAIGRKFASAYARIMESTVASSTTQVAS